jgi:drug/metabolite transporter (DMT)-like permease
MFIAATGTLAQTIMNNALEKGELALLLPFDFLRLIWSVLIGYALFAEEPEITLWIGGVLIIGSTSYIAWREAKLKSNTLIR